MGYTLYCAYFASHSVFPHDLSAKLAKADSYDHSKPSAGAGSQAAEVPLETTDDEHNYDWHGVGADHVHWTLQTHATQ